MPKVSRSAMTGRHLVREKIVKTLIVVGGASGVGKTSVISPISETKSFSTGDYFKSAMRLADRDKIRTLNWLDFQADVSETLSHDLKRHFQDHDSAVIDTHFAAKESNGRYVLGLSRPHLHILYRNVFGGVVERGGEVKTHFILIDCNPTQLLDRRRNDSSRDRELHPADCVRSISRNRTCFGQFLFEGARAKSATCPSQINVSGHVIVNEHLEIARASLEVVLKGLS
jgi:adenylate kinase